MCAFKRIENSSKAIFHWLRECSDNVRNRFNVELVGTGTGTHIRELIELVMQFLLRIFAYVTAYDGMLPFLCPSHSPVRPDASEP